MPAPTPLHESGGRAEHRLRTGIGEFDRVLGGGLVPGSVVLLGGEPGIGKSTLALQCAGALAKASGVLVASAEESADQVALRAKRLGVISDDCYLLALDDISQIVAAASKLRPDLLVVDSIQAVRAGHLRTAPGSPGQIRETADKAIRLAKDAGIATVLLGHVTKVGDLAGPKALEHVVDVVLSLEGDSDHGIRMLRSLKNRYGSTDVVGLFEMREQGLVEVSDPSGNLVADWSGSVPGSVIFPTVSGRRCVLVEVQALVARTTMPQPRRSVRGLDAARVHQTMAVLERHAGLRFFDWEAYVRVVGGVRVDDPGADLPVALALASSLYDRPVGRLAAWGEVGLTGEVRAVPHATKRAEEAERMGIDTMIAANGEGPARIASALELAGIG